MEEKYGHLPGFRHFRQFLRGFGAKDSRVAELEKVLRQLGTPSVEDMLAEARLLADEFAAAGEMDALYEDVYHAAVMILRFPEPSYFEEPRRRAVYRGQRNENWRVFPSLYRPDAAGKWPDEAALDSRLEEIADFAAALEQRYPGRFTEIQRVAIKQHYLQGTWLLDVTTDPFVGLFFASLGGREGDVGVMTEISLAEWQNLSAHGRYPLGAIRTINAGDVPRIIAQKGLFLEGSHQDLMDQYVPFRSRFRQKAGLVFEDRSIGVTKHLLMPDDDEFRRFAESWSGAPKRGGQRLSVTPPGNSTRPLTVDDYLNLALLWVPEDAPLPADSLRTLRQVCEFHRRLQEYKDEIRVSARSLRRLKGATESIQIHGPATTFDDAISQYREHAMYAGDERMKQIVNALKVGTGE